MAFLEETRFIERLQFFNGQRLFAPDLQGIEAFNREMRWLHNKSLHQPGIGSGFAVYGKKGDREVTIGPGYAIDAWGREIVLTETQTEAIPPLSAESDGKSVFFDLTVSYPDDSELEEAETREGVCLPRGVVRLREAPVFCWARLERDGQGNLHAKSRKLKEEIKNGLKIVLARLEVFNCQLQNDVSIAQRRSARPAKQPHIACGVVDPTIWKPLPLGTPDGDTSLAASVSSLLFIFPCGLTTTISTTSAGFKTVPCYNARIEGSRVIKDQVKKPIGIIDGLISIREPKSNEFTVDVLLLAQSLTAEFASSLAARRAATLDPCEDWDEVISMWFSEWKVVWMGVEG